MEALFAEWKDMRTELTELHRQRDSRAAGRMTEALVLYERLLASCSVFGAVPVNGEERLEFIKSRSENYAAFLQLDELFSEMGKKVASKQAQLKNRDYKG